ncbi:MAG: rRNA maturation RNase YbeY [Thermodesulfobacteriota bacterium]
MTVLLNNQSTDQHVETEQIRKTAEHLLKYTGQNDSELSILLTDDSRITELNNTYRQKDRSTNVLSFPLFEPETPGMPVLLGDIVISVESAAREARLQGIDINDYLNILLVHGLVHILGYDHEKGERETEEMAVQEKKLLEKLQQDKLINLKVDNPASVIGNWD